MAHLLHLQQYLQIYNTIKNLPSLAIIKWREIFKNWQTLTSIFTLKISFWKVLSERQNVPQPFIFHSKKEFWLLDQAFSSYNKKYAVNCKIFENLLNFSLDFMYLNRTCKKKEDHDRKAKLLTFHLKKELAQSDHFCRFYK